MLSCAVVSATAFVLLLCAAWEIPFPHLFFFGFDLAINEKLYSYAGVERFIADTSLQMEQLKFERSKVYNKIRGCKDPTKLSELTKQRDTMTEELAGLRNKLKLAQRIIDDQPLLRGKVEAEKEQMREWYFPCRTQEQNKGRHRDDGAR